MVDLIEERIRLANEKHRLMQGAVVNFPSVKDLPEGFRYQMAQLNRSNGKDKILVLYYGGTLGMEYAEVPGQEGAKALVASNDADKLLRPLKDEGIEQRMQVNWLPILGKAIDSTNGRWPHWVSIANAIELLYDDYDGFVVAGGTDTMDYLMASMHFILPNIGKPIIGAAAQQPIGEWGTDAVRNLGFSLQVATEDISGAHLAFNNALRHGLHIFKVKDKGYDAFDSPNMYRIGEYTQGNVVLFGNYLKRNNSVEKKYLDVRRNFLDGIRKMSIDPLDWAESLVYDSQDPAKLAILLMTYGAGNVRDESAYPSEMTYIEALKNIQEKEFPVVLGSSMMDGSVDSSYMSGVLADKYSISGGDTTGAALVVKMSRAASNAWNEETGLNYDLFKKEMNRNHVGELTVKK